MRLRGVALAALVCTLALAYWQWRVIAPVRVPQPVQQWNQDLFGLSYPVHVVAYRGPSLLPAWNAHQLAGMPLLATYSCGLFYPPNLLSAVLPVRLALGWGTALHVALGGVFVLLCTAALGLRAPAALVAAVAFMLNARIMLDLFRPPFLAGLAWIPCVFLCAGHVVVGPRAAAGVLLGVAVGLQILTGHAQIVCYSAYGIALAAAVYLVARRERDAAYYAQLASAAAIAVVTALGLAAIQLLPTAELLAAATRGALTFEQTAPDTPTLAHVRDVVGSSGPAIVVAALAAVDRRRTVVIAASVVALFAVLVGVGTGFYTHVFYHLPGGNRFRWPQEMVSVGAFALAIVAAVGLDGAQAGRWGRRRRALAAALAVLAWLAAGHPPTELWWSVAALVALGGLLVAPGPRTRTVAAWVVAAVVVAQRFVGANVVVLPQHEPEAFFAPRPFVDALRDAAGDDRVLVVKNWKDRFPVTEMMGSLYGLNVVQDYEALAPEAYRAFLAPLGGNVDAPLFWGRFHPPATSPAWRLLDMLAVRYVVVATGGTWAGDGIARFRQVYADREARIYENDGALRRTWIVPRWRTVADAASALAAVHDPGFDPRREAVVTGAVPDVRGEPAPVPAEARILVAAQERVEIEASTPAPALLVLADLHFPGWRVEVDGEPRPLLRADYLLRAVALAPGRHRVRFTYRPWTLRAGAAVTGVTVVVLIAAWAQAARRSPAARARSTSDASSRAM